MGSLARSAAWSAALLALLLATVLASAAIGPVHIDYLVVTQILLDSMYSVIDGLPLTPPLGFEVPREYRLIVMELRMPRIVVGAGVGFALGAAGAVMQGFFRNPMADPAIIGVSSGAAVGAVATIALAVPVGLEVAAFVGAVVTAGVVYALATRNGRTSVATLLLAGVAVQTFLGAVISFMLYNSGESLRQAVYWLMGNLVERNWSHAEVVVPAAILGFAVLMMYSRDLNVLLLGEEDAHSLGVEVERTKRVLLLVSSLMTAAAVAVSGVIGFVGLIVPHAMRLVVGPDHRVLLPASALGGAIFLVLADALARSVLGAAELPVGIVTAFVGVPFFLYLLRQREAYEL